MKLFKSLLVAPATLGLLAPLSVTANEINLADVSNYSSVREVKSISEFNPAKEIAVTNGRVDGIEARLNDFEAGSFSDTTSASFGVDFLIGSEDGTSTNQAVTAGYSWGMKTKTSFTGEDTLQVKFDAGNADDGNLDEFDKHDKGDGIIVDGISYKFPIGDKTTVILGDSIDGSTLYDTACVYGGPSKTLSDCGSGSSPLGKGAGTALGVNYDIGSGFTANFAYTGEGSTTDGLMTEEGLDAYGGQLAYSTDSYGASVTYATIDEAAVNSKSAETVYWALNGYWTPSESGLVPSISVGLENGAVSDETGGAADGSTTSRRDTNQWFVGIQWDEAGPGKLGAAVGSKGATVEDSEALQMYEVFYSYKMNDSTTITPLIYVKEAASGSDDATGMMVKTTFKF